MAAMADAVRTSTSNIAASLGGAPISIRIDPKPIVPPTPQVGRLRRRRHVGARVADAVDHLAVHALRDGLTSNLTQLQSTDWEGNAKLAAIDAVSSFTASAKSKCDSGEQSIATYVRSQLQSVVAADR